MRDVMMSLINDLPDEKLEQMLKTQGIDVQAHMAEQAAANMPEEPIMPWSQMKVKMDGRDNRPPMKIDKNAMIEQARDVQNPNRPNYLDPNDDGGQTVWTTFGIGGGD